jgi:hypothetical protein
VGADGLEGVAVAGGCGLGAHLVIDPGGEQVGAWVGAVVA